MKDFEQPYDIAHYYEIVPTHLRTLNFDFSNVKEKELAQTCISLAKEIQHIREAKDLDLIGKPGIRTKRYRELGLKLHILFNSTIDTIEKDLLDFQDIIFKINNRYQVPTNVVSFSTTDLSKQKEQEFSK